MLESLPSRPVEIVPSVLPADLARLGEEVVALQEAGVDRIQWDVMDGRFVPNLTFGADVIAAARAHVEVPFEAHLMVHEPSWMIPALVDAGCELLIVHAESVTHLHRVLGQVLERGARAAVALTPASPPEAVEYVLDLVSMVLVMTVNPGFGGQRYIPTMEPKIERLRSIVLERELDVDIEVDGGVGPATIGGAARAGANVFVAGSSLFADAAGLGHAVAELRRLAAEASAPA
jgi:ribulose-phosphate 3-epimerase